MINKFSISDVVSSLTVTSTQQEKNPNLRHWNAYKSPDLCKARISIEKQRIGEMNGGESVKLKPWALLTAGKFFFLSRAAFK